MNQEPFDDAEGFKLATYHESIPSVYGSSCGPCSNVSVTHLYSCLARD